MDRPRPQTNRRNTDDIFIDRHLQVFLHKQYFLQTNGDNGDVNWTMDFIEIHTKCYVCLSVPRLCCYEIDRADQALTNKRTDAGKNGSSVISRKPSTGAHWWSITALPCVLPVSILFHNLAFSPDTKPPWWA